MAKPKKRVPSMPEPTYSLEEVAQMCGVTWITLHRHYKAKKLPEPAMVSRGRSKRTRRFTRSEAQEIIRIEKAMDKDKARVGGRPRGSITK